MRLLNEKRLSKQRLLHTKAQQTQRAFVSVSQSPYRPCCRTCRPNSSPGTGHHISPCSTDSNRRCSARAALHGQHCNRHMNISHFWTCTNVHDLLSGRTIARITALHRARIGLLGDHTLRNRLFEPCVRSLTPYRHRLLRKTSLWWHLTGISH